jgi:pimeloyl-ACP methyl ester carboxylesterase
MMRSDRKAMAIRPLVLLIALLAALGTACSSSHASGDPGSTAARPTSSVSPVVVLVHGFEPDSRGYSCAAYWEDLETAFNHWNPNVKLVTVGYSHGDHVCDMRVAGGGVNAPIEELGRKLATAVYQRFSARGIPVVLVGHSMGGLVVQSALAQAGSRGGPPYLLVPRAITISTPHGGTDALKRVGCFAIQCNEMAFKSKFLHRLEPDPQGRGGTVWTLFGSAHDHLVTPASSMGMPAAHRYLYEQPHYGHNGIITDPSPATNALRQEIATGSPVVQSGVPHSLRAIFLATGATISRAQFAGVPPVGAKPSTPANDGKILFNISPASGGSWNIYTDGRIVITGHSNLLAKGANPFHVDDVQRWLTPHGVQLLRSRILAIAQPTGLLRRNNLGISNKAYEQQHLYGRYEVRVGRRWNELTVGSPPPKVGTPAQLHAVARINTLIANMATQLPASAWKDTTLRPYIPTHYCTEWDRAGPDPARLPSPARELLAQLLPSWKTASGILTTDQARALFTEFAAAQVKLLSNQPGEIDWKIRTAAKLPGNVFNPAYTILRFQPGLPDGGC